MQGISLDELIAKLPEPTTKQDIYLYKICSALEQLAYGQVSEMRKPIERKPRVEQIEKENNETFKLDDLLEGQLEIKDLKVEEPVKKVTRKKSKKEVK